MFICEIWFGVEREGEREIIWGYGGCSNLGLFPPLFLLKLEGSQTAWDLFDIECV